MLIVLVEEYNTVPIYCLDETVYKRIRRTYAKVLGSETVAEEFLSKFWHYTLRQLSCASAVDVMGCFVLI